MQSYMYEKAMAPETRNGGASTLNNNGVDSSKRKLLIVLDIVCLILGKCPSQRSYNNNDKHQCITVSIAKLKSVTGV